MYFERTLTTTITKVAATFPVILLTGPRQVGKTTLLAHAETSGMRYVTMDDVDTQELAKSDPNLFLQTYPPPVIIDEIQYVPELLTSIKIAVDKNRKPGMFYLTGSQKYHLMRGVSESLAGRVAILELQGLSHGEKQHNASEVQPFIPDENWLQHMRQRQPDPLTVHELYREIWSGSFPELYSTPEISRDIFYNSYVQSYIQRDVRALAHVQDTLAFNRFLRVVAARTGQLVNYADMAQDVDVDQKTIKEWLSILEASGLIYLLQPYHNNVTKRLIKTPKLYFLDTGLAAWLTRWTTPEILETGAMSGAILETWLLSELLKTYWHNGLEAPFYFYRDKDKQEIDLLIEQNNTLYPIEFKKTATPSLHAAKSFHLLQKLNKPIGPGAVLCLRTSEIYLARDIIAVNVGAI